MRQLATLHGPPGKNARHVSVQTRPALELKSWCCTRSYRARLPINFKIAWSQQAQMQPASRLESSILQAMGQELRAGVRGFTHTRYMNRGHLATGLGSTQLRAYLCKMAVSWRQRIQLALSNARCLVLLIMKASSTGRSNCASRSRARAPTLAQQKALGTAELPQRAMRPNPRHAGLEPNPGLIPGQAGQASTHGLSGCQLPGLEGPLGQHVPGRMAERGVHRWLSCCMQLLALAPSCRGGCSGAGQRIGGSGDPQNGKTGRIAAPSRCPLGAV